MSEVNEFKVLLRNDGEFSSLQMLKFSVLLFLVQEKLLGFIWDLVDPLTSTNNLL
jgi:hypothetical protein